MRIGLNVLTMMVHFQNAGAAHAAMVGPIRFDDKTFLTISQCARYRSAEITTKIK